MSKFEYLPSIVSMTLFCYFLTLVAYKYGLTLLVDTCYCCNCILSDDKDEFFGNRPTEKDGKVKFRFEDTYESFLPGLQYVLVITRLLSLCYIFLVPIIMDYLARGTDAWYYFTVWNSKLIAIYFFFAIICSIIGFIYKSREKDGISNRFDRGMNERDPVWSSSTIVFGSVVHVLYQVCGGTAVFITVINYSATDPTYAFWNVSHHFMTLLTLILELFLNNMYVRADHYLFNMSWAVLYLICIWPVVVMNKIPDWPYPFLATDTYLCCFHYIGLFTADFLFYYVFYALSMLKYSLRSKIQLYAPIHNDNAELVYHLSERSPL